MSPIESVIISQLLTDLEVHSFDSESLCKSITA